MANETNTQSFWEHLDVLRTAIVKIVAVAVVFGFAAFFFKEELFSIVLAPKEDGFVTYRLLYRMAAWECCVLRLISFINCSGSFPLRCTKMNGGM